MGLGGLGLSGLGLTGAGLAAALVAAPGCATSKGGYGWFAAENRARYAGAGGLHVEWTERITDEHESAYMPVERAVAALHPARDRIYIGSTGGQLYALSASGTRIFRYDAGGAIEGHATVDPDRDELYFGDDQGVLHALRASDGELRWRDSGGEGPIRKPPVLGEDAVYVVTDTDEVLAFAREDGGVLWSYDRPAPETFSITEHAGLVRTDGMLITGFTDGVVVALDEADGTVLWERDTSLDVETEDNAAPRFVDVDTTPVIIGDRVFVASFSAGLYALARTSGTVLWHDSSLTGIVGLTDAGNGRLVVSSADEGVLAVRTDAGLGERIWTHPVEEGRGSPTTPVVAGEKVLVGEADGAFLALDADTGRELSRFEAGHGFTAQAAARGGLGFVLSDGGTVFAFRY